MTENKLKVMFFINEYDSEGDCTDKAIFLHVGEHIRFRFNDIATLIEFRDSITNVIEEIS